jgi:hypothetical protein
VHTEGSQLGDSVRDGVTTGFGPVPRRIVRVASHSARWACDNPDPEIRGDGRCALS